MMFDAPRRLAEPVPHVTGPPTLARSFGAVRLMLKRRGDLTVTDRLFQSGCLKARFAASGASRTADVVLINTAGGLTGGDHLAIDICWSAATHSTVTSQAAEKIYRSIGNAARVTTTLEVGPEASGEWLPQETILFNQAALERQFSVHLAPDARFLGLEAVIFGRGAMGEIVGQGRLRDAWRIWRGGRLIYADALDLNGAVTAVLRKRATANGANALATLIRIGADAPAMRDRVRAELNGEHGCACSSWKDLLVVRLAAHDGAMLRRHIVRVLRILREGRPLPRLWQC